MLCEIMAVCCCGLLLLLSVPMAVMGQVCPENRDTVYNRGAGSKGLIPQATARNCTRKLIGRKYN